MQSGGNEIFCGKDLQLKETVSRICCFFFSHHPNLACRRELNSEHITDKPAYFLQSYLLDMYHILKTSFEFRSFVKVLCKKKVPVTFMSRVHMKVKRTMFGATQPQITSVMVSLSFWFPK